MSFNVDANSETIGQMHCRAPYAGVGMPAIYALVYFEIQGIPDTQARRD